MAVVFKKPDALLDVPTHYCPGCTHGIIHRLVAEVIDELGILDKTIGVAPVGCSVLAYNYFACDMFEAAHGRAPAVATGIKRSNPDKVVFTYQGDGDLAAIGTAEIVHAINCARAFVGNEPFAVMLGDDVVDAKVPCLRQLIDCYDEYRTTILGVQQVPQQDVSKYGIVKGTFIEDSVYKVKDLVEKPSSEEAPSNIAILGRYIITPEIFNILDTTKPGKGNEIQLTDALKTLMNKEAMYAYTFEGRRYDVGDKMGFLQATVEFALKRNDINKQFMEYLLTIKDNPVFKELYDETSSDKE